MFVLVLVVVSVALGNRDKLGIAEGIGKDNSAFIFTRS
jgi:hypothetical protein